MPQANVNFDPIGASETVLRGINFVRDLDTYEALLTGTATCVITVDPSSTGNDPNPQNRLRAGPTVNGTCVDVLLGTCINGVTYCVLLGVNTTFGQTPTSWALLVCNAP